MFLKFSLHVIMMLSELSEVAENDASMAESSHKIIGTRRHKCCGHGMPWDIIFSTTGSVVGPIAGEILAYLEVAHFMNYPKKSPIAG